MNRETQHERVVGRHAQHGPGSLRGPGSFRGLLNLAAPVARFPRAIGKSAGIALNLLLPPRCLICRSSTDRPGELCATCWAGIRFIDGPGCQCCGFPFAYDQGPDALCAACHAGLPVYGCARSVMVYDDNSRGVVLALKHGDRLEGVPTLAKWMTRAGHQMLAEADVIAPVPLHRWRLLSRRYNQSALLANRIADLSGITGIPDLLVRTRATPSQGGRSRSQRQLNVRGAFSIRPGHNEHIKGRNIVVVDDVLTTGATVEACARTLLRGGAHRVDILTLARVVRAVPVNI